MVQKLYWLCWLVRSCLLVELHWKGAAINAATRSRFNPCLNNIGYLVCYQDQQNLTIFLKIKKKKKCSKQLRNPKSPNGCLIPNWWFEIPNREYYVQLGIFSVSCLLWGCLNFWGWHFVYFDKSQLYEPTMLLLLVTMMCFINVSNRCNYWRCVDSEFNDWQWINQASHTTVNFRKQTDPFKRTNITPFDRNLNGLCGWSRVWRVRVSPSHDWS